METDVVCPDCGKVIAPRGTVADAARCRCAENAVPKASIDKIRTRAQVSVPIPVADEPEEDDDDLAPSTAVKQEKKCYVCGKSLEGRTRLKDHLGRYWCKECAAADERAKKREEELRCPDCGRAFPANKLVFFQTTKVCNSCFKEREKALEKKIIKSQIKKTQKTHEWNQLKWMAIIAGGLILIATVVQLLRHH